MVARVFDWSGVLELTPPEIEWWYVRTERAKAEDRLAFLSDVQTAMASMLVNKKNGGTLEQALKQHIDALKSAAGYTEKPSL